MTLVDRISRKPFNATAAAACLAALTPWRLVNGYYAVNLGHEKTGALNASTHGSDGTALSLTAKQLEEAARKGTRATPRNRPTVSIQ